MCYCLFVTQTGGGMVGFVVNNKGKYILKNTCMYTYVYLYVFICVYVTDVKRLAS